MQNLKRVKRHSGWRSVRRVILMMVFVVIFLAMPSIAAACPNCKNGLRENYLAIAFALSVLFMMAMPFSILVAWIFYIVRLNKTAELSGLAEPKPIH